jgi:phosphatidylglycerol:prolipoprotein diacylglycerol transferase
MYPVLLSVGPVGVQTAGVVAIIAIWFAAAAATKEMARQRYAPALVPDFVVPALVAGLVGARLAYVLLSDPAWYLMHPWQILAVWRGGVAEEGAFLGGLGAAIWWCRKRKVPFWVFADALAPALALGGAIAHLGAFLGGAGYGTPATALPWAVTFTDPSSSAPLGIPLHPTQLYESGLDLALLGGLRILRHRLAHPGQQFLLFLLGSALVRIAVDPVKGDVIVIADPLTSGQLVAGVALAGAAAGLVRLSRRGTAKGADDHDI